MKFIVPLLAVTLFAFAGAPLVHAEDNSAIEAKLKQNEDTWEKAFVGKDATTLASLIADDFAGVSSRGKMESKSQLLDEMKKDPDTITSATNGEMNVHVYGPNLATVVGTSTEKGKHKNGKRFSNSYAWIDTWMQRDGNWQCVGEGVVVLPGTK